MKNSVILSTFVRTFSIVILQPTATLNFLNLKTKQLINQQSAKFELMESKHKQLSSGSPPSRTKETKVKMMLKSFLTGPDQAGDDNIVFSKIFFPIYFSGSRSESSGDGAGGAPGVRLRL